MMSIQLIIIPISNPMTSRQSWYRLSLSSSNTLWICSSHRVNFSFNLIWWIRLHQEIIIVCLLWWPCHLGVRSYRNSLCSRCNNSKFNPNSKKYHFFKYILFIVNRIWKNIKKWLWVWLWIKVLSFLNLINFHKTNSKTK